jgi:hypothetical protein
MYNPGDPSLESHPTEYFHHQQQQQQEDLYNPSVVHAPQLHHTGHQLTPPNVGYPLQQPNYDFAYCETQWMYYDGQQCGQYEAYCFREAYAFSHMQVKPFPIPHSLAYPQEKDGPVHRICTAYTFFYVLLQAESFVECLALSKPYTVSMFVQAPIDH